MRHSIKENLETAEKLLETLKDLLDLRDQIEEENEGEAKDERKPLLDLKAEYDNFFKWALGVDPYEKVKCENGGEKWKELHPDLPIPRIFSVKQKVVEKCLEESAFTLLFFMDAYPLYLEHKKNK